VSGRLRLSGQANELLALNPDFFAQAPGLFFEALI
jgi:hypothetical protein